MAQREPMTIPDRIARQREHANRYSRSDKGKAKSREWYHANKVAISARRKEKQPTAEFKEYARGWRLMRRYGITRERYAAMLATQDGLCAICHRPPVRSRRLAVDHSHKTGVVRGLLCDACNNGIARFADDPARLHRAIEYLRFAEARDA